MLEVDITGLVGTSNIRAKFQTPSGNITALFGPSGAGKSTIINMIAGLLKPSTGIIKINDKTFFNSSRQINLPPEKRNVGYVFQDNRLFPHLNVESNLCYGQNLIDKDKQYLDKHEIVELLDLENLLQRRSYNCLLYTSDAADE